ncbi:MAG: SPOR domain-containing protein [Bacteroidetes bacterium]|nr:SPOR domain-containing protein [Bacteroidota bacterium]
MRGILPSLIKNNPQSSSLKYLEALLTQDGRQAASLYKEIVHSKSNSEYKDDALFKLYQFHYTLGEFNESDKYARMILESYPSSQFISRLKKSDYTSTQSSLQQRVEVKTPEVNNQDKSSAGNFTTQVGAFLDRKNAESLMIQVLKYGESWINEREVRGKIFYAVLVGKFSSESDANTLLERMRAELNLQGVILNLQ